MKLRKLAIHAALGLTAVGLAAFGGPMGDSGPETDDGVKKERNASEAFKKSDAWDHLNNPERFQTELTYNWQELKNQAPESYTEAEVWPATYWPMYKDGINQRWQGGNTLSPAEKYDRVYNDWKPEGGFSEFKNKKPFDTDSCEWDEGYYEQLGPAAKSASKRKGNWKAHNGQDDDGDGVSDAEECGYGDNKDYDGVETWFGLCHAWVPAAILEKEPDQPVTVEDSEGNPVTFAVSDIKALLISQYDRADSHMVGGRCNARGDDVPRNDNGRVEDGKCQDVNPGSFHVLITNFLGLQGRPIAEDRVYNYEVWNQPIIGYNIQQQEEISEDKVRQLVGPEDGSQSTQPQSEEERAQVLRGANELSETDLNDTVGLNPENASALVTYREEHGQFESVETLTQEVSERAAARLLDYAYDQSWLEDEQTIADYNENADSYVRVKMAVDYVTESHASTEPMYQNLEEYTRTDNYEYILELDAEGNITGGEWIGRSIESHPDFLWLPTDPGGGNQNIDLAKVHELLSHATSGSNSNGDNSEGDNSEGDNSESEGDGSTSDSTPDVQTFGSTETASIPDNNPQGVTSTVEIGDIGNISDVTVELEIEHTYRGDLLVVLEKGETSTTIYSGDTAETPWNDDLSLSGITADGFEGMPAEGEWTLKVVDTMRRDTGQLKSWKLTTKVE
ncbi:MAG: proprotein convertase P-domain-containing protein [Bradymonadaceae bacterium]